MDIDNTAVAGIVVKNGQHIPMMAKEIVNGEFASSATMARNEKEQAECEKIANSFSYELVQNGSTVVLKKRENEQESPYEDIIVNGMPAPYSGGDNGMVTEPDGTQRPSLVPPQLWGQELSDYAKDPDPSFNNIEIKLQSLAPGWISDVVEESKSEIAELIKPNIIEQLQSALGGGS